MQKRDKFEQATEPPETQPRPPPIEPRRVIRAPAVRPPSDRRRAEASEASPAVRPTEPRRAKRAPPSVRFERSEPRRPSDRLPVCH